MVVYDSYILKHEIKKLRATIAAQAKEIERLDEDRKRLNWLDLHTAFVADGEYRIGPYKRGELRKMADDGIAIDKSSKTRKCRVCGCTDDDCSQCIEAQGHPCFWVEDNLCNRCEAEMKGGG